MEEVCIIGLDLAKNVFRLTAPGRTGAPGPAGPNQRWSLDFVSDVLSWSRCFRVLAVVDNFTREVLALVVDSSIPAAALSPSWTH